MLSQPAAVSLRELIRSGVTLSWQEAIALARGVAAASSSCVPRVAAESVILDSFALGADGAVVATSVDCPAVSVADLAMVLGRMLPTAQADPMLRAPAGVHFALARALGLVHAAPFASLDHFCTALARYEQGGRTPILQAVFERCRSQRDARRSETEDVAPPERRSTGPRADGLRRLLREADREAWLASDSDAHHAGWTPRRQGPDAEMLRRFLREADRSNYDLTCAARMAPPRVRRPPATTERGQTGRRQTPPIIRSPRPVRTWSRGRVAAGVGVLLITAAAVADRQPFGNALSSPVGSFGLAPSRPVRHADRQLAAYSVEAGTAAREQGANASRPPTHRNPNSYTVATQGGDRVPNEKVVGTAGEGERVVSPLDPLPGLPPSSGRMIEMLDVAKRPIFSPSFEVNRATLFDNDSQPLNENAASRFVHVLSIADDRGHNYHPRLSPDGSTIAFDSDRDGSRGIYLASRDGRHVRRISGAQQYAAFPAWSPDGNRLAFVQSEPDEPTVWNVWSADLRSGATTRLTSYREGQPWGVSWFPDGTRICFAHENEIVVLDTATGTSRAYPSPRPGKLVRLPAVSPDGARVVFQLDSDGAWLLELADGSMRQVLADPSVEDFAWSHDGKHVLFRTRDGNEWTSWSVEPERDAAAGKEGQKSRQ